jgi:hypothetical protein
MPQLAVTGAIAAYSAYQAHKSGQEANKNTKPLIEAQTNLYKQQTGLGDLLKGNASKTFAMGQPVAQQGFDYYSRLMGGSKTNAQSLFGPEREMISDTYRGADRGLEQKGLRGGSLDQAKAESSRQKSWQMADLVPKARQAALPQGMSFAQNAMAPDQFQAANAAYGNAGMTGASTLNTVADQSAQSQKMWGDMGSSIMSILLPYLLQQKAGTKPKTTTPSKTAAPNNNPYFGGGE